MDDDRRDFLRLAGTVILGVGGGTASLVTAKALLSGEHPKTSGKRLALAIDTNKCAEKEGCTACIEACHSEHNVPDIDDPAEEVKWLFKQALENVFPARVNADTPQSVRKRPVLVTCNHCEHPPCTAVCPTGATWKSSDGPVMMDQHRCIGCRYCVVACPYGARSFNFRDPRPHIAGTNPDYPTRTKGTVEKCTMCTHRLAKGLLPSCVEACQATGPAAILFGDLNDKDSEIHKFVASSLPARRREELGTEPQVFYSL